MDKSIGVGIMVGVFISIGFLIYELSKKAKDRYVNKDLYKAKKEADEIEDKLEKIRDLYNDGYLTQDEFNQKSAKLKSDKTKKEVEQTAEYKKLKDLYNDGILTKEEFESKANKVIIEKETEEINYTNSYIEDEKFIYNNQDYYIKDNLIEGFYLITDFELNYGFANKDKIVTIKPKYEFAESFSDGLALVRLNQKFGFIDYSGKVVIDLMYDDASSFKNGIADVEVGGLKYTINKNGERV